MKNISLKSIVSMLLIICVFLLSSLTASVFRLQSLNSEQVQASASRYHSYLLADELRQSSDDLTRLARTFVITADPIWEQQYFKILKIRNGEAPRPEHPERIVWDFEAAGMSAGWSSSRAPLKELMAQKGFLKRSLQN